MTYYKKCNLIAGWFSFAVAAVVYIMTMEPTASLWDCAEFIATSYKLEVGHPPGAPLFMMIARFFTIFAPSPGSAAMMVNLMSSLCSAFTILFLCWTITHLARKVYTKDGQELSKGSTWSVMGAGLIGALAYTFTDTFWFSAVEGEVYAMSSMFTAMVVWAMLQWENVADKPHSTRWLILIAYLMGLSIGIHILNLLTIPALVLIYYFKKYPKITKWGVIKALLVSGGIIVAINYVLVPYSVAIGAAIDRLFVNGFGLPINTGITVFAFLLFGALAWGIWRTHKKGKVLANTIILCSTVIVLGFSTYASMVIRASANPPMNSNNPNNPYALLSLLKRDQYGSKPLLYGPYYSSPRGYSKYTDATYVTEEGKYASEEVLSGEYHFPTETMTLFPRMWNMDASKRTGYETWGNVKGKKVAAGDQVSIIPTGAENMRFFFSYQLNFMYWRYFLWNFAGRQSDIQGTGDILDGNWLSGIDFIDEIYLGPQSNLPSEKADNKGRNKYYFLPLIFGLIGLIYHYNRDRRDFWMVMSLFLMMGIVLVIYFNTAPGEPRERDYVYAGSFYAFCIWIGFAVMWLRDWISKSAKKDSVAIAVAAVIVCSCVPVILAARNWNDHDRSGRYTARDIGWNYLQSCLPNSVVLNWGDNDTFPLWYNQEVEGVRTDVRVMNMSYIGADWNIDQMKLRADESAPLPLRIPRAKYIMRHNEAIRVLDRFNGTPQNLREVMLFFYDDQDRSKIPMGDDEMYDYIPVKNIALPVNKGNAVKSGIVKPEDAHLMVDTVYLSIKDDVIYKPDLIFLDLLANFNWERPIHFTSKYMLPDIGLQDYLQFDGFTYRFVPIKTTYKTAFDVGRIDTEVLEKNIMEVFHYCNVSDPKVYSDPFTRHTLGSTIARPAFAHLANKLLEQGDSVRAVQVLDTGMERIPFSQLPPDLYSFDYIESYYKAGATDKGNVLMDDFTRRCIEYVEYYTQFSGAKMELVSRDLQERLMYLDELMRIATVYGHESQKDLIRGFFDRFGL